jgi:hypothetical protein
MCTYILVLLHGPEFSTMNALMALISIISLRGLLNLNFSVFCEVLQYNKLRKCCQ